MQLISKFIKGIRFLLCTIDIDKGGPKFKVSDHVRISRYNNIFSNWSEEVFMIKKVKNTVLLIILKTKKFLERFTKNNCKKQIKKCLESKK